MKFPLFALLLLVRAPCQEGVSIYLEGTRLQPDVAPVLCDGTVWVPITLLRQAGLLVHHRPGQPEGGVAFPESDVAMTLFAGRRRVVRVAGRSEEGSLSRAPFLLGGHLFVPLREVAEWSQVIQVRWNGIRKEVYLSLDPHFRRWRSEMDEELVQARPEEAAPLPPAARWWRAEMPPWVLPETFLWGVCQVGGTGKGAVWPLSRSELETLRDELHINALRFFVHPGFVGLPQKTWNGPEAIDYTQFAAGDYVWHNPSPEVDSLDEVLELLYDVGLRPFLLPLPVDEYVAYLSRDDLTFLNDAEKGLDYTGIRPVEQVKALSVAVAKHVHEKYGGNFSLIYTEIAGQGDGAPQRTQDRAHWAEIVAAVRAVAPAVPVYSPELCIGMWWWAVARPLAVATGHSRPPFPEIPYIDTWPRGDRLEHYARVFDGLSVSYYGAAAESVEWKDIASDQPALKAATDPLIWLAREYARPKKWLWAEAGWGAVFKPEQPFHLDRDLAALLFGMDHCRGALLWQGKDNEGSKAGVFTERGEKAKGYELLQAVAEVVWANADFFATDHPTLNPDGFPVAERAFQETDPAVLTRFLGRHVVIFSEAPVMTRVTLTDTRGQSLREVPAGHGYSRPWPLSLEPRDDGSITVAHIRPRVLYLLAVESP